MTMTAAGGKSPLHIISVGWDASLLEEHPSSDATQRHAMYARLLQERRPGSRLTVIVLGAPRGARIRRQHNLVVLPLTGRWTSIGRLPSTLARLHRELAIGAITTQSPFEDAWAALAFSRGRIPVVAQVHFDLFSDAAVPKSSWLRRKVGQIRRRAALAALPRYAAVRAVAADTLVRLRKSGAGHAALVPVPILDLHAFSALSALPRPLPQVLFVGRLAPEKRLDLWLDVAKRIRDRIPDARFDIVGDGASRPVLERLARNLQLATVVRFHGVCSRAELPSHFARARLLLLTSDHEGFGRVLVEAMAAGVAIVSTRTVGAIEVVGENTGAGVLAPVGNAEALASAAAELLENSEFHKRVTSQASARINGRYVPLSLASDWIDMLVAAAERKP